MSPLTVAAIRSEVEKLRRGYFIVCHPSDAAGVQHALDQIALGAFTTVTVRPTRFVEPGNAFLIEDNPLPEWCPGGSG